MIDRIDGPIIDLELRQLEVLSKWLLHYPWNEGRLTIIPLVGLHRGMIIIECIFDSLLHLFVESLELPFGIEISGGASLEISWRMTIGG